MNLEKLHIEDKCDKTKKDDLNTSLCAFFKNNDDSDILIIEATVPTGFEKIALSEIKEKINIFADQVFSAQGRIYFIVHKMEYSNVSFIILN